MPTMAMAVMHEQMHRWAKQKENYQQPITPEDVRAVFIEEEKPGDGQEAAQNQRGTGFPEASMPFTAYTITELMVVIAMHDISSFRQLLRPQFIRSSRCAAVASW
jgi:hypothetical protein